MPTDYVTKPIDNWLSVFSNWLHTSQLVYSESEVRKLITELLRGFDIKYPHLSEEHHKAFPTNPLFHFFTNHWKQTQMPPRNPSYKQYYGYVTSYHMLHLNYKVMQMLFIITNNHVQSL